MRSMSLATLVDDPSADIRAIARHLDALPAAARLAETRELGRRQQRALFEKAGRAAPLDLGFFVGDAAPLVEVIHDGRNTLPLVAPLRLFQKRFCRPAAEEGRPRLFGYNHGPTEGVVGPGYFVAVPTRGRPAWEERGAVVVDYFQVPDGAVAPGWPRVRSNHERLSRFVYFRTRDFMRRVSAHVSIGAAYKDERALDHYFVLCRQGS